MQRSENVRLVLPGRELGAEPRVEVLDGDVPQDAFFQLCVDPARAPVRDGTERAPHFLPNDRELLVLFRREEHLVRERGVLALVRAARARPRDGLRRGVAVPRRK